MYHGSLISYFLCLQMVTGTFQARGPYEALMAMLGGDAELPCFLMHHQSIKNMKISWTRSLPSQVVHLYEDGRDKPEEAMEEYFGRTQLVKNVMHKGTVVLRIHNVQPSDSGQYRCAFQHGSFYSDTVIELKVAALGSNPQFHVEVTKSSQLRLECKSEGWFPQPKVQWMDSEGGEISAESETHTQDKGGLFHVTTSLLLREPSQKNLICSIWNPVLNQKKEEQLSIAVVEPISTTVNEPINTTVIPVVTSLAALLIMLISIGLYLLSNRLKNWSKNRSGKHQHYTHHRICQATPPMTRDYAAVPADHVEFYAESDPEGTSANAPRPAILAYTCVAATNPDQDGARAHMPGTAPSTQKDHNTSPDKDSARADPPGTTLGNTATGADTSKATDADLDPEATCTYPSRTSLGNAATEKPAPTCPGLPLETLPREQTPPRPPMQTLTQKPPAPTHPGPPLETLPREQTPPRPLMQTLTLKPPAPTHPGPPLETLPREQTPPRPLMQTLTLKPPAPTRLELSPPPRRTTIPTLTRTVPAPTCPGMPSTTLPPWPPMQTLTQKPPAPTHLGQPWLRPMTPSTPVP
ncbi:uncharacterized protein [Myotis yumanensis]|uniref:uncharacterized protein n=1 Tax=Myotis yumanensis TaxID=159337 RepID=UPI0038D45F73